MRELIQAQQFDMSDPAVLHWMHECGLAHNAVSLRLIAPNQEDLELQVKRLQATFGALLAVTRIQPTRDQRGFVAYGTLLG